MTQIVQALWIPCLTTIVLTFALRPIARGMGLVDRPGGRKTHVGDVPIVGGIAMLAGVIVGSLSTRGTPPDHTYLLAALVLLVFIGAVDDRYELPATVRFLAQILAALFMIYGAGLSVTQLGHAFFGNLNVLGIFSVPFTILIVLAAVNAFNMFDGSDGVAGIQALIGLMFLAFACLLTGNTSELPLIASLIGSIMGFLVFNWPSRRTHNVRAFMGDAGSTMLGFSLAWLSVSLSQGGESAAITPIVALWIFALPIFDLFSSMIRRMWRGQSPFHADTEHLHHLLKRFGLSSRRVALFVLLVGALFAAVGVGGFFLGIADGWLLLAWLLLGLVYFIVVASDLVFKRRQALRPASSDAELQDGLWRQRN